MITKLIGLVGICVFFHICVKKDALSIVPWKLGGLGFMALAGFITLSEEAYLIFLCMLFGAYTDSISERVYSVVTYIIGGYELIIYCINFNTTKALLVPMLITVGAIMIYSYAFKLLGEGDADILVACAIMCANIGVHPACYIIFLNIFASAIFLVSQSIRSVRRHKFIRKGAYVPALLSAFCLLFVISYF